MSTWLTLVVVVVLVVVVALVVAAVLRSRRSRNASSSMGLPALGSLDDSSPDQTPGRAVDASDPGHGSADAPHRSNPR